MKVYILYYLLFDFIYQYLDIVEYHLSMIAEDIPETIVWQLRLWEVVKGTFANTNFVGGSDPFDNPRINEGEELFFARDRQVRVNDN